MIKTHGLTHLNLEVRDPDASLKFYQAMFGVEEYFRDTSSIQVQGPASMLCLPSSGVSGRESQAASVISDFAWYNLQTLRIHPLPIRQFNANR